MNDVVQYEHGMVIQTKTRHQTPIVRATSVMHIDDSHRHCRSLSMHLGGSHRSSHAHHLARHNSGSSTPDGSLIQDDRPVEPVGKVYFDASCWLAAFSFLMKGTIALIVIC